MLEMQLIKALKTVQYLPKGSDWCVGLCVCVCVCVRVRACVHVCEWYIYRSIGGGIRLSDT